MTNYNRNDVDQYNEIKSNIALESLLNLLLDGQSNLVKSLALRQFNANREHIKHTIRNKNREIIRLIGDI